MQQMQSLCVLKKKQIFNCSNDIIYPKKRKLAEDPFYRLENEVKDKEKAKEEKTRLHELLEVTVSYIYASNSKTKYLYRNELKMIMN